MSVPMSVPLSVPMSLCVCLCLCRCVSIPMSVPKSLYVYVEKLPSELQWCVRVASMLAHVCVRAY